MQQADHAGQLEAAVGGYAKALRHLTAYLRLETDESSKAGRREMQRIIWRNPSLHIPPTHARPLFGFCMFILLLLLVVLLGAVESLELLQRTRMICGNPSLSPPTHARPLFVLKCMYSPNFLLVTHAICCLGASGRYRLAAVRSKVGQYEARLARLNEVGLCELHPVDP